MRSVAFRTSRCVWISFGEKLTVCAPGKLLADFGVTRRAVHPVGNRFARPYARRIHLGMALAAGDLRVGRFSDSFRIDSERPSVFRRPDVRPCVAPEAILVRHSLIIKHFADLVGLMAVDAGGKNVGFFLPQFAPDDFTVHAFDLGVTLCARRGDVFARDR